MSGSFLRKLVTRPVLQHMAAWTLLLVVTVSVASVVPKAAFMNAISRSSYISKHACGCSEDWRGSQNPCGSFVMIPLEVPGETLCVPESMVGMSDFDFLLPTVFAAIAVFGSTCLLKSLGLWEDMIYH